MEVGEGSYASCVHCSLVCSGWMSSMIFFTNSLMWNVEGRVLQFHAWNACWKLETMHGFNLSSYSVKLFSQVPTPPQFYGTHLDDIWKSLLPSMLEIRWHRDCEGYLSLTSVPMSFILASANSLRFPCSTPELTSGIGMSLNGWDKSRKTHGTLHKRWIAGKRDYRHFCLDQSKFISACYVLMNTFHVHSKSLPVTCQTRITVDKEMNETWYHPQQQDQPWLFFLLRSLVCYLAH